MPATIALVATASGLFDRLNSKGNGTRTSIHWWNDFPAFSIVSGFVISFAVITAVQTKLMWYILYVYPFAALIVGLLTRDLVTVYHNKTRKL